MKALIFEDNIWFCRIYDGRKKEFKGITKKAFYEACEKHARRVSNFKDKDIYEKRRILIEEFRKIPYEYKGDGLDDFNRYQRPTNGGYVAICPGERGNNIFVIDNILVNYLTKKYNKAKGGQKELNS